MAADLRKVGKVSDNGSHLIPLGEGVYSVSEISHILRPTMTSRKVHYWLKKGILGPPVRPTGTGRTTLLTFEQLLKVRTVQHLRDNLQLSLRRVALTIEELSEWVFDRIFTQQWYELHFYQSARKGAVVVTDGEHHLEVGSGGSGQLVIPELLRELEAFLYKTREDWQRRAVDIEGFPRLISNARVLGGSPIIQNTRIETAFVAHLSEELDETEILNMYSNLDGIGLKQALQFEGRPVAA